MKNKLFLALLLTIITVFNSNAANSFGRLNKLIDQGCADFFANESVLNLSYDDMLLFLHMTYLFIGEKNDLSEKATMAFAETIKKNKALQKPLEIFSSNFQKIIEKYMNFVNKKFEKVNPNPTKEEGENFGKELFAKLEELIVYINQVYYKNLFDHLANIDGDGLLFMISEDGNILPQDERTELLPYVAEE